MLLKSLALAELVSSEHLSLTQMLSSIAGGSQLDQGGGTHPFVSPIRFAHSICVSQIHPLSRKSGFGLEMGLFLIPD